MNPRCLPIACSLLLLSSCEKKTSQPVDSHSFDSENDSTYDDFESCRSMKHYFEPSGSDWAAVKIFSPIDGVVNFIYEEWAGTKVQIRSLQRPAFYFDTKKSIMPC